MSLLLKFAWRNIWRNLSRSIITGLGIALGMAMCMATLGIMEGLSHDLVKGTTDGEIGHIQIHREKYLSERKLRLTIDKTEEVIESSLSTKGVTGASARLYSWGYLSSESRSIGVQLLGINPINENKVTTLSSQVVNGEFIKKATPWVQSQKLNSEELKLDKQLTDKAIEDAFFELENIDESPSNDQSLEELTNNLVSKISPDPTTPPSVIIGVKLAKNLSVTVGDHLNLLFESSLGAQSTISVVITGLSKTGDSLVDRTRVIIHLSDLQKMLALPNQAHEIALKTKTPNSADIITETLKHKFENSNFDVQSWSTLRPDILALIMSNEALMGSLVFIIFLISGVGVMNSMLVSVMERQQELSVMKALGVKATGIVSMVMLETFLLSFISAIIGIVVGSLLGLYLTHYGWDISDFGEFTLSGVGIEPILRASMTENTVLIPFFTIGFISLLAALYPAIKAAKVSPSDGMRSV